MTLSKLDGTEGETEWDDPLLETHFSGSQANKSGRKNSKHQNSHKGRTGNLLV